MIQMSKKVIGLVSGSSAALIATTTVTANVLIKDENGTQEKEINPLHPDKNEYHYSLVDKLSDQKKLNSLITTVKTETGVVYILEKEKFVNSIIPIVQDALSKITKFSDYQNYVINVSYKINTKSILVDLVWYKPNQTNKFYDQFELQLHTA